jgi:hypothetical protein
MDHVEGIARVEKNGPPGMKNIFLYNVTTTVQKSEYKDFHRKYQLLKRNLT